MSSFLDETWKGVRSAEVWSGPFCFGRFVRFFGKGGG